MYDFFYCSHMDCFISLVCITKRVPLSQWNIQATTAPAKIHILRDS
ncbi:hypothetical protein HMPREF1869_01206 [Bacteroidales bacterium KA00251]|nr:hypothetical protein HMPREF1869_01206 [Bacteroidales bacterium KA00251]